MSKICAAIAGSLLIVSASAFAVVAKGDDSGTKSDSTSSLPPASAAGDKTAPKAAPAGKHHEHGGHDHAAPKRAVLSISTLTDKQKEQVNAVYAENQTKWDDLQKQMRDLREAEWTKIKPILTPEQLDQLHTEVRNEHKKHHQGGGHGGGSGSGAAAGAGADAPAKSGPDPETK